MSSSKFTHVALVRRLIAMAAIVMSASPLFAAEKRKPEKSDKDAIRAAIDSYVAAYNRGDAKAVAAFWSDSGEWISPSGQRLQGKQAIEKEMRAMFSDNRGVRIEVINPSIRMVSPQVAIEEGTVRVIRPSEPPSDSTYLAVDVKESGQWKLNTVRETDVPETQASSSQLQELAWLVGDWVDDSPEVDDSATITWTKNKTFVTYAFKISEPGSDDVLEGTQVIGWDPAAGTHPLLDVRFRRWIWRRHLVEARELLGRQVQSGLVRWSQGIGHQCLHLGGWQHFHLEVDRSEGGRAVHAQYR